MKDTDNTVSNTVEEILCQLKGQLVESISVERSSALDHTISQMVILHLPQKDISIWSEEVENRPDEYPDLAQISVYREPKGCWDSLGERLVLFPLGEVVDSVELITDIVTIKEKAQSPFHLFNTRGIAVKFGSKTLWLEKEYVWSEVLKVTLAPRSEAYVFQNEWTVPVDDDETTYQSETERRTI